MFSITNLEVDNSLAPRGTLLKNDNLEIPQSDKDALAITMRNIRTNAMILDKKVKKCKHEYKEKPKITGENFKEFLKNSTPRGCSCPRTLLKDYDPFPDEEA